ncbi:hypothetical protein [Amycolatopsis sp. NPDC004079]|uniref:hypothetical protein n=1 Tax=Amycolatopsis sp. NPDC004079 TaxID=3154549 RepID=UPI0033B584E0
MNARETARATPAPRTAPRRDGFRGLPGTEGEPLHKQTVPKGIPLWPDQIRDLKLAVLALGERRSAGGRRITDATLARIGVDLVLLLADEMHGDDEEELNASAQEVVEDLLYARELLRKAVPDAPANASTASLARRLQRQAQSGR